MDLNNYLNFVDANTSKPSKNSENLFSRINELENVGLNVPRFLTGGIGLASESGEFLEIVKKVVFQGKEYNEEVRQHGIKELGDVCFYLMEACLALNVSPEEVIQTNFDKLKARYPNGFEVAKSENRKVGDV